MSVPYTFATATGSIPLSQLDSNFATGITIGNTSVLLGGTITTLNNLSLANVAITSVSNAFPNGYLANSNVIVGTTTLTLGSTVTAINGLSLSNVTISSGNVTISNVTTTNVTATTANVTTANIGTLVVIGDASVGGNTTVTGNITAAKGTFTSANVSGTANVQVIAVTQNATIAGNATITGNVSAANGTFTSANVSGTANVQILSVTQDATVSGNATVLGNVAVSAAYVASKGTLQVGTISYTDTGIVAGLASNVAGYNQLILQNISTNAAASTNFNISNDAGTSSTNFGEFGINSSTFTGTGSFSQPGYVYLAAASTDLAIGTYASKSIRFVVNSGATDAAIINASGNVGVGTASPATKLDVNGTITATSVNTQNTFGFKNRIINGAMGIWQRGTSGAITTSPTYVSADRWGVDQAISAAATFSQSTSVPTAIAQYSGKVQRNNASTGTNNIVLAQAFETANSYDLAGQSATLSFYAKAGANFSASSNTLNYNVFFGTGTDQSLALMRANAWTGITNSSSSSSLTTTWTRYTFTVSVPAGTTQVGLQFFYSPTGTAGADDAFYITSVQLEKGSTATSFDYRPYGTELQLCQRYFENIDQLSLRGAADSGTVFLGNFTFVVEKRASPTATLLTTTPVISEIAVADRTAASATLASAVFTTKTTRFQITGFSGLTARNPMIGGTSGASNNVISLSAEL